jgi:hypothetical protein
MVGDAHNLFRDAAQVRRQALRFLTSMGTVLEAP